MRQLLVLLLLAPLYAMGGVIATCSSVGMCGYSATETAVGNLLTVDLNGFAERSGTFTLDETILLDLSGVPAGSLGIANVTMFAGALGFTSSAGGFATIQCSAMSANDNPDSAGMLNHCYNGGPALFPLQSAIPLHMGIQAGGGLHVSGAGEVYLQVAFSALDPSGQRQVPVGVSLLPEPSPVWLCGAGLVAAAVYRRRTIVAARSFLAGVVRQ
jgi:hypothetical protein